MHFPELIKGRLLRRYKRFLADVQLDDGSVVTAHCANPGSMKSLLEPLPRVWLSRAPAGRKLPYTWEVAEVGDARVYVNPAGANRVVLSAIRAHAIKELCGYDILHSEVKLGSSRIDFLLTGAPGRAFVEVKNVTLGLGGGRSGFPDAVTSRGTRHLQELRDVASGGDRAVLLFCVARTDAVSVEAAHEVDPVYAQTLRQVSRQGVEILAYGGEITEAGFTLCRRIPVVGLDSSV